MAEEDNRYSDHRRGFRDLGGSVIDHGVDYIEARLELAKLEAEEACSHVKAASVRFGIGAFAFTVGYAIFVVAGIGFISAGMEIGWQIPALIIGALHLIFGALFLLGARRQAKLASDLFPSTRRELIKDQQWLRRQNSQPESNDQHADERS